MPCMLLTRHYLEAFPRTFSPTLVPEYHYFTAVADRDGLKRAGSWSHGELCAVGPQQEAPARVGRGRGRLSGQVSAPSSAAGPGVPLRVHHGDAAL